MTILKPPKGNSNITFIVLALAVAVVGCVFYISQYNTVAGNRYEIRQFKEEIVEVEDRNVELKNDFYQIVDPAKLEKIAEAQGLVLEQNPDYMNINQWVSDSSY